MADAISAQPTASVPVQSTAARASLVGRARARLQNPSTNAFRILRLICRGSDLVHVHHVGALHGRLHLDLLAGHCATSSWFSIFMTAPLLSMKTTSPPSEQSFLQDVLLPVLATHLELQSQPDICFTLPASSLSPFGSLACSRTAEHSTAISN